MSIVQSFFGLAASAVGIYTFIIFIRIIMSWMGGGHYGRFMEILSSITDPYLQIWRGMRFLRFGHMDFSPVFGIIILGLLQRVLAQMARGATASLGYMLAILVSSVSGAASFFVGIFAVMTLVRFVSLLFRAQESQFWFTLERIVGPATERIARVMSGGKGMEERMAYGVSGAVLLAIAFGLNWGGGLLAQLLVRLPV